MKKTILFLSAALLLAGTVIRAQGNDSKKGTVEVAVDYQRQPGPGSNQYAIWVEDADGKLVRTLFVTRYTAEGGYVRRPDCTPTWVAKADAPNLGKEQTDAFSGATPQTGIQTYVWDGTNDAGAAVAPGTYTVKLEGTYKGASQVRYEAAVTLGSGESVLSPSPQYNTDETANIDMIKGVTVRYIP